MLAARNQQFFLSQSRNYVAAAGRITEQPTGDLNIVTGGGFQRTFPSPLTGDRLGVRKVKVTITDEWPGNMQHFFGFAPNPSNIQANRTPHGWFIRGFGNGNIRSRTRLNNVNGPNIDFSNSVIGNVYETERAAGRIIWRFNGAEVRNEADTLGAPMYYDMAFRLGGAFSVWNVGCDIEIEA